MCAWVGCCCSFFSTGAVRSLSTARVHQQAPTPHRSTMSHHRRLHCLSHVVDTILGPMGMGDPACKRAGQGGLNERLRSVGGAKDGAGSAEAETHLRNFPTFPRSHAFQCSKRAAPIIKASTRSSLTRITISGMSTLMLPDMRFSIWKVMMSPPSSVALESITP